MKLKKRRLKIGIICYPSIGGSGIVATELGNELARLGHEVHFISYDVPFRANLKQRNVFFHQVEINTYKLFKYPDYTLPLAVKIDEVHHNHHLDILHVHYAIPHAAAALFAQQICEFHCGSHPKIVTTLHGTDISLLGLDKNLSPIIKYSIENSDGVTAVSKSLKNDTEKLFRLRKQIKVVYNFYDAQRPTKSTSSIRKSLGIAQRDVALIHLSNLRPVKRIPDLLRVTANVAKKEKHIKLLILSGGDFSKYNSLVRSLKIKKNLIIKESVKGIGNYISAADIGVYPSETESFGMGILEVMSYGRPVVATRVGGIPEVVDHGKSGFLSPVGNIASLTSAVLKLVKDPDLRAKMGGHAAERARKLFSADTIVAQYLEYYYRLMRK